MSATSLRGPFGPVVLCVAVVMLAAGCTEPEVAELTPQDDLWQQATLIFKPLPDAAPNPENPVTEAKVSLGEQLYFDKRLSKRETISCNSCHSLATFGVDNLPFSPGDEGQLGGRNSPSVLNAALHKSQFWDGRAKDVEEQAGMPILNPVEMAIPSEQYLVDRLSGIEGFPELFAEAFPEDEEPLSYANVSRALAAFERTLLTPSRFDRYLEGDLEAISDDEKAGLKIFRQLGCTSCHNGQAIGGHSFRKFGLNEPYWEHTRSTEPDEGRYAVTGQDSDLYVFKVASLRNIAMTYPYFHDGSVADLDDAVRVMAALQIGADLTDTQAMQLGAFLKSLTGELPEAAQEALQKHGEAG